MLEAKIFYLREKCVVASSAVVQALLSDVAGPKAASRSPSCSGQNSSRARYPAGLAKRSLKVFVRDSRQFLPQGRLIARISQFR